MISSILSRLVILLFGTLYPAYSSYKAVRTKNVKEYVKWMMYWIVFALFTCAETITDIFLSFWFPFYYEFKIILVVYLLSPATNGSSILYRKFVHPVLTKKEQEIDECIAKAMENGYHTMLNLGSKSVAYATSVIMQTAIKGGGGLVNHIKKSYSLDDITTGDTRSRMWNKDEVDNGQDEERQKYRRRKAYSPRRTVSSASPADILYPELDEYKRSSLPLDHDILRNIRSSEDISSGYSSTEQLFTGAKYGSREQLPRTNSMGPTMKTRSRVTKKANPEDESGCSTTEPDESQYEADEGNPFPFLIRRHSGNFLVPFVKPEYRYLFANLTEQQMCNIGNANPPAEQVHVETSPNPSTVLQSILSSSGEGEKEMRNGRRKKNQAPLPPNQKPGAEESDEETGFTTPDSSPVLARKEVVPVIIESGHEDVKEPVVEPLVEPVAEPMAEPVAEVMTESLMENKSEKKGKKGKGKSGESQISKMLHLSKIQIPFWGQKSGKHSPECSSISSMSRNSSHHSLSSKGEQESFISLKDYEEGVKTEPDAVVGVREMSQSPSSKRRSFVD